MTKAIVCGVCAEVVGPTRQWQTDRSWRWCSCGHSAVRWRDGDRGLLEVVALHGPDDIRVLGLNNGFIEYAFKHPVRDAEAWRTLHRLQAEMVGPGYLFHKDRRNCWALLVKPGESSDVFVMDYAEAWAERPGPVVRSVKMSESRSCPNHRPIQHRDGKPAWCPNCGLTAGYEEPKSRIPRPGPVVRPVEAPERVIVQRSHTCGCMVGIDKSTGAFGEPCAEHAPVEAPGEQR